MAKTQYINNEEMYQLLWDLREYGDYDNEVYMLRKKNFKGLTFNEDGSPNLDTIESDDPKKKKNPKTKEEKIALAKSMMAKDKVYKAKCEKRLSEEAETDTILRLEKVERIRNKLGRCFLDICNNLMKLPSFTNYSEDRKGDMISDATWVMTRYMNRYDLERKNPFAYFTTACRNAFIHQIDERKKYSKRFKSLSYIENLDGEETSLGEYDNDE
jgi:hypothetical protein